MLENNASQTAVNVRDREINTFAEEGEKTFVTLRMLFKSAEERDYVVKAYGAIEGGNQTLNRLERASLSGRQE